MERNPNTKELVIAGWAIAPGGLVENMKRNSA